MAVSCRVGGGGAEGRRQRRDVSRKESKTQKTGKKCSVLGVRPVNSHIKLRFLLTRRSGRTLRTRFPPPGSAIFRSVAAKRDLARKPNSKKAFLSENRNMLKMRVSRAFFASISKSKGSKTPKTGEICPVLRLRPVNSHIKLRFLLTGRSSRTLRTRFPPPGSAIFRPDVAKKEFAGNTRKYASGKTWEKGLFEPNVRQSEGFFRWPRHPEAPKTGDNNAKIWFLEGWASFETWLNLFWAHVYFAQKLEIALSLCLRLLWTYVWDCLRVTLMEPISEHLQNHAVKHYLQSHLWNNWWVSFWPVL